MLFFSVCYCYPFPSPGAEQTWKDTSSFWLCRKTQRHVSEWSAPYWTRSDQFYRWCTDEISWRTSCIVCWYWVYVALDPSSNRWPWRIQIPLVARRGLDLTTWPSYGDPFVWRDIVSKLFLLCAEKDSTGQQRRILRGCSQDCQKELLCWWLSGIG